MIASEQLFFRYTEPYRTYGEPVLLKIRHTLRVRDHCLDLADSIALQSEDRLLAEACGLLHDIGRFEQWKRYGTYNDARSADHGDLGAEVLLENGLLNSYPAPERDLILNTVKYHNKLSLPETMTGRDRLFSFITRDADKLDILYSCAEGLIDSGAGTAAISEPVFCAVLENRIVPNSLLAAKADRIAFRIAFAYDLHFRRSAGILQENDLIGRMVRRCKEESRNEQLKTQLEILEDHIRGYLAAASGQS